MIHLWCGFYVSQPLFDEAQLDGLQSVINRVLPDWSSGLCAAQDEDSKEIVQVGRDGSLYECIHRCRTS